jgi:hypothetical protein
VKNNPITFGMEQKTEEFSTGTYWYVLEWTEPDTNTKLL